MKQLQQGDVNIHEIGEVPNSATPRRSRVVAEGEATGHVHEIVGDDVEMYQLGDEIIARILRGDARIVHQEHGAITLQPGIYSFRRTQEIDHFADEARLVMD